jgi:hypothetical protein
MDYISKEENSYNKMRPDPKYMDLQPVEHSTHPKKPMSNFTFWVPLDLLH